MKITAITRFKQGDLWHALKRLGWTQRELSRRAGLDSTVIGDVINLRRKPTQARANAIQKALAEAGEYVDVLAMWPETFNGLTANFQIEQTSEMEFAQLEAAVGVPMLEKSEELEDRLELLEKAKSILTFNERSVMEDFLVGKSASQIARERAIRGCHSYVRASTVQSLRKTATYKLRGEIARLLQRRQRLGDFDPFDNAEDSYDRNTGRTETNQPTEKI